MKLVYTKILDQDIDEYGFCERYYDSLPRERKVDLVRQVTLSVTERTTLPLLEAMWYLELWEMDLLHSILWKTGISFTNEDLADQALLCVLSAGHSIKAKFKD
jgi:hypothetical protein